MLVAGVICEYNPFHLGHLYQIESIKKSYSPYIVALMSGNFTQRGEPAIISKFLRAKIAVDMGVSLVLELPSIFSTASAENFANGGISILKATNIIDRLFFGCEDSCETLNKINNKINNFLNFHKVQAYLKQGYSYVKSVELACDFLSKDEKNSLKKPNNILGIEYIRAIEKLNANFSYQGILRSMVDHNSEISFGNYCSSSYIRKLIYGKKDISRFICYSDDIFKDSKDLHFLNDYYDIFKYKILKDDIVYNEYMDYENGIENRFIKNLNSNNIYDFINNVNSKRYTSARVRRLIIEILLDLKKDLIKSSLNTPYIRVLAMDDRGKEILNSIEEKKIIKFKESLDNSKGTLKEIMNRELLSTNIYNLKNYIQNEDFIKSPYVKKS